MKNELLINSNKSFEYNLEKILLINKYIQILFIFYLDKINYN